MRILIDTDVLIDVALARQPHAAESAAVLRWVEAGGEAAVAWHTLANCAYLLKGGGRPFLSRLMKLVEVAATATADARRALELPMTDLEDAFQAAAALSWAADAIVTRNVADYRRSPVRALTPAAFLKQADMQSLAELRGSQPRLRPVRRRR